LQFKTHDGEEKEFGFNNH